MEMTEKHEEAIKIQRGKNGGTVKRKEIDHTGIEIVKKIEKEKPVDLEIEEVETEKIKGVGKQEIRRVTEKNNIDPEGNVKILERGKVKEIKNEREGEMR